MTKAKYKELKKAFKIRCYKNGVFTALFWVKKFSARDQNAIRSRNNFKQIYFYLNEKYKDYVIRKELMKITDAMRAKINEIKEGAGK